MTSVRQRLRDSNTSYGAPTRYAKHRSETRYAQAEDLGYLNTRRLAAALFNWDALAMLRQAFVHAFLPSQLRGRVLKDADALVYQTVLAYFTSDDTA